MSDLAIQTVVLAAGENSGVAITNDGTYCYAVMSTVPTRVVKVRMSDMVRVAAVTLQAGEDNGAAITHDGTHCYVVNGVSATRVTKIRMSDMVRVGGVTLPAATDSTARAIAHNGTHCFVVDGQGRRLFNEIRMSDMVHTRTATWPRPIVWQNWNSIVYHAGYCYLLPSGRDGWMSKTRVSDLVTVGAVQFHGWVGGIIHDGTHCYFAQWIFHHVGWFWAWEISRVRMSDLALAGRTSMRRPEGVGGLAHDGTHCYVVASPSAPTPFGLMRIRMEGLVVVQHTHQHGETQGGGVTYSNGYCYVVCGTTPARIVKIRVSPRVVVALI